MAALTMNDTPQTVNGGGVAYLVEEQANPSTDFFVLPAVMASGCHVVHCGFDDLPAPADLDGAVVVFVRYVPPAWARLVEAVRSRLRALVLFMDDDVLDVNASAGMPWRYRFKLARLVAWRCGWLRRQAAEIWVSSSYLQQKYADWHPKLVLPSYLATSTDVCRMFYHGTASHDAEIRWLRPVLEEALLRDKRLVLEIVGGRDVYRLYRGLPRVTVVHPMRWPAYQSFLSAPGRHIGLAPLLALPFNRGRSYTKFFDITCCGAAGIYSPGSSYSEVVSHGENGLIVELEPEAWVTAILELARNEQLRQSLLSKAEIKSAELANMAKHGYSGLLKRLS